MNSQTIIITHNGTAHVDDFMSCCLLLAKEKDVAKISRLPSSTKIEDVIYDGKKIFVDIGRKFDITSNYFDHHQMESSFKTCSFNLLLTAYYGISIEEQPTIIPQASFIGYVDTNGMISTLKDYFGIEDFIEPKTVMTTTSLVETLMLSWFAEETEIYPDQILFNTMKKIGQVLDKYINERIDFSMFVSSAIKTHPSICGKTICSLDCVIKKGFNDLVDAAISEKGIYADIIISRNSQNPKQNCITRLDSSINFSKFDKFANVEFAHKSGFFAVFKEGVSLNEILNTLKNYLKQTKGKYN